MVVQTSLKGGSMHAAISALKANKPLLVVDYSKDLGDIISGNIYLKRDENGGAIGIPYIPMDTIIAEKQKYLQLLQFDQGKINKGKCEDEQLSLF